jgi:hypothetical protein
LFCLVLFFSYFFSHFFSQLNKTKGKKLRKLLAFFLSNTSIIKLLLKLFFSCLDFTFSFCQSKKNFATFVCSFFSWLYDLFISHLFQKNVALFFTAKFL